MIDPAWARTGEGGFLARYDRLLDGAARETQAGPGAGVRARLGLARFLVGSDLAFEAIGVLNTLLKASPALGDDAEFRGLRGAARAMVGRWKDAVRPISPPPPPRKTPPARFGAATPPPSRATRPARAGSSPAAAPPWAQFPAKWRARLARADAETAVAVGDLGAAKGALALATGPLDPDETDGLRLAQARLVEASGQAAPALALYEAVARSPYGAVAAPAELATLRLRLAKGAIPVPEALAALDSLRFRWRGDATEMETIRELGRMDIAQGRYREALEALRSAGGRLPDLPASIALHTDLADAFKALFLEGRADGMEPIQALALFYDFKELTPVGADGDLMVRRLVKRLADVDLLDQAADLLRYQVDNRLNGAAKAQVATDLAAIELMAGKPDGAINAIEGSRSTLLPMALNIQRRLLEARALVMLGRYDHALELVGTETSPDALEVKALARLEGSRLARGRPLDGGATGRALEVARSPRPRRHRAPDPHGRRLHPGGGRPGAGARARPLRQAGRRRSAARGAGRGPGRPGGLGRRNGARHRRRRVRPGGGRRGRVGRLGAAHEDAPGRGRSRRARTGPHRLRRRARAQGRLGFGRGRGGERRPARGRPARHQEQTAHGRHRPPGAHPRDRQHVQGAAEQEAAHGEQPRRPGRGCGRASGPAPSDRRRQRRRRVDRLVLGARAEQLAHRGIAGGVRAEGPRRHRRQPVQGGQRRPEAQGGGHRPMLARRLARVNRPTDRSPARPGQPHRAGGGGSSIEPRTVSPGSRSCRSSSGPSRST